MRIRSALVLASATLVASIALADWPQFMGANRDGISTEKIKLAKSWPADGPKVLWTADVGPGYGGAAIVGNELYILDRANDKQDVLRCLDFAKGTELWSIGWDAAGKFDHNGSRSTPAVDDKYVYAVGPLGDFYCVDRKTHKEVWKKNLLTDFGAKKPNWACSTSPLLYKDLVIVAPMGKTGGIVAYKKDGTVAWASPEIGSQQYVSPLVMTIGGVEQIVAYGNKSKGVTNIAAVDPASGKILWNFDKWGCNIPIAAPVHVGDGKVFMSGGYGAGSVMFQVAKEGDSWTTTELWRLKSKQVGSQICDPMLVDGYLYVDNNENDKNEGMTCVDLAGNVKWKSKDPNCNRGGQILADGMLYKVDGSEGILYLIQPSPEGLKLISQVQLLNKGEDWAPLSISAGKLIIRDHQQMKCLDVR